MVKPTAMFVKLVLCLIITITIFQLSVVGDDHQAVPDHQEEAAATYTEKVKSMFSFFTITSATTATSCWEKAKMMAQQVNAYFFPPNLDFRGSDERGKVDEGGGGGGAGKKVKEAVSKSWEESKSTVEETAKSAANLAEDTVHKTTEKVKKTLSGRSEPELSSEL